ncbi:hypothetical protein Tsubulata_042759 [Turnera subulata]|uniref:Uncharacterized protein n=1 Tax=Turnera subulata TaxID=218843 RepID=A0A9Q0JIJ8_9ROSI|nr:hypothetical protein Tsubulata_042759 [Turnera subulata]
MPESRDRLSRPVDYGALLARTVAAQIYQDPPEIHAAAVSGSPGPNANARAAAVGGRGRGGFGTPRAQLGRGTRTALSPSPGTGRENVPPPGSARRGRGRGSPSPLPSWYPRTPLRDITAVVRVKACVPFTRLLLVDVLLLGLDYVGLNCWIAILGICDSLIGSLIFVLSS